MVTSTEFEILAKLHGLSVNKNGHNYIAPITIVAKEFWDAQQVKIDRLTQEVCDLTCAARMFQHVLDNPVKEEVAA